MSGLAGYSEALEVGLQSPDLGSWGPGVGGGGPQPLPVGSLALRLEHRLLGGRSGSPAGRPQEAAPPPTSA